MQEKQIKIKEEESKEEDRQEEAGVKNLSVKNGYADLKHVIKMTKIRKLFKWADRGKN